MKEMDRPGPVFWKAGSLFIQGRGLTSFSLLLLFLSFIPACNSRITKKSSKPDVVLITIDALRADHLSCYGYERATSPFIDRLAARGSRFNNCFSPTSWTRPAMASLFTGLHPRSHGVITTDIIGEDGTRYPIKIDESFTTLAEILKAHGYTTLGITSNPQCGVWTNSQQGFEHFIDFADEVVEAEAVHKCALKLKAELAASRPYFFWIHYLDPHAPYTPRYPWIEEYGENRRLIADPELNDNTFEGNPLAAAATIQGHPEKLEALIALYDSEINHTDHYVEKLFREVLPEDVLSGANTLIIITADHGEEFLDHGLLAHGQALFGESVGIPLIIIDPEGEHAGAVIIEAVSLNDIFPTVLDYLNIPVPSSLGGFSLLPYLRGSSPGELRDIFFELEEEESPHLESVLSGSWKFIRRKGTGVRYEEADQWLFNIAADPGEQSNLINEKREVAQKLGKSIDDWKKSSPKFIYTKLGARWSEEQREQLKALGYIR